MVYPMLFPGIILLNYGALGALGAEVQGKTIDN